MFAIFTGPRRPFGPTASSVSRRRFRRDGEALAVKTTSLRSNPDMVNLPSMCWHSSSCSQADRPALTEVRFLRRLSDFSREIRVEKLTGVRAQAVRSAQTFRVGARSSESELRIPPEQPHHGTSMSSQYRTPTRFPAVAAFCGLLWRLSAEEQPTRARRTCRRFWSERHCPHRRRPPCFRS